MIKDAKGRKWFMRFKQYREGWQWTARHHGQGIDSGWQLFPTRAAAEEDARHFILSCDHVAVTPQDHEAIWRAAQH